MTEDTKLAVEFASDLAKQIMTLSTAVITATISFTKDIVSAASAKAVRFLRLSWVFFLLSLISGVWTLMALTGSLASKGGGLSGTSELLALNVRLPASLQIVSFLLGVLFVILFGRSALLGGSSKG